MVTTQSFGQPLQPLQAAGDSDCDGSASDSEPLLRVLATAGDAEGSDNDDHCEDAATTGRGQSFSLCKLATGSDDEGPVTLLATASDDEGSDDEGTVTLATAGDHIEQPCKSAAASDDEGSDDEGAVTLATHGDHIEQLCKLATASDYEGSDEERSVSLCSSSDDEGCLGVDGEGTSSGPPSAKRARCSVPSLPVAASKADVKSLFSWPRVFLEATGAILGRAALFASCLFEYSGARMSTHFSGLGSAETAWRMVRSWARITAGRDLALQDGWACEKTKSLQRLLQAGDGPTCVFKNILDRLPDVDDELRNSSTLDYHTTKEAVMRSRVVGHASCATHGSQCPVSRTEVNVSGSPCRPWSKARAAEAGGPRRNHKDILLFLAWCRIIREDKPGIVIHENVRGFDARILEELLGDLYDITAEDVSPQDLGFSFIARPRIYSVLTLRGRIERTTDVQGLYRAVVATAARTKGPLPSVLVAGIPEVLAVENHLRAKRGMSQLLQPSPSWRYLLTDRQASCLSLHEGRFDDATCLLEQDVDLTQTFAFARPMPQIPTIRRSSCRVWSWKLDRWLLPSECAAAMGFPIHPWCAQASGVPTDTTVLQAPIAIGNAMHVANVGAIMVCALAACRRVAGHG